jgi:hypothetical protein
MYESHYHRKSEGFLALQIAEQLLGSLASQSSQSKNFQRLVLVGHHVLTLLHLQPFELTNRHDHLPLFHILSRFLRTA